MEHFNPKQFSEKDFEQACSIMHDADPTHRLCGNYYSIMQWDALRNYYESLSHPESYDRVKNAHRVLTERIESLALQYRQDKAKYMLQCFQNINVLAPEVLLM